MPWRYVAAHPLSEVLIGIVDEDLLPVAVVEHDGPLADGLVHVRGLDPRVEQQARVERLAVPPALTRVLQTQEPQGLRSWNSRHEPE